MDWFGSCPYVFLNGVLFRKVTNGMLLQCIHSDQMERILKEFHDGDSGGHFAP